MGFASLWAIPVQRKLEDRYLAKFRLKIGILLAAMCSEGINAFAQDRDQLYMNAGEAKFYPSVKLEFVSNDNVLRDSDAVSTSGIVVSPNALFVADRRGLDVQFGYEGAYGAFDEDSINFADHRIFGSADAIFGVRKRGSLNVSILKGHESLGSGLTRNNASIGDEQVEYVDGAISGSFTYGAPTARFNVTGGLLLFSHSFQNRADVSDGRSYSEFAPFGQVSYRLSEDTRVLLQVRYRTLSFDDSTRDRNEFQTLTGLAFKGSGKLGGELKLGISQPDYADANVEDDSVFTVDTSLTYELSSLSIIKLRFGRELDNGGSLNQLTDTSQIIDDNISLSWKKNWSGFVSSNASITAVLVGGGCPVDRADTVKGAFDIRLKAKRWMTFGVGVASTSYSESLCDSTAVSDDDYDLVELTAFVRLTL